MPNEEKNKRQNYRRKTTTYVFNMFFFPLADCLPDELDVLVTFALAVALAGVDVLAALDGALTVLDFGNGAGVFSAGALFFSTDFFLLQPNSISQDNIMNLNCETYTALSNTCCLCMPSAKSLKPTQEGLDYLFFFTGLGVKGAVLLNVLQSEEEIDVGTKTYTRFLPDVGVLGTVLGFFGESLVGLKEKII